MALKLPALEAAKVAIQSIGCGYDLTSDLRLKYCKGDKDNPRLIDLNDDQGGEIVLPGGNSIHNVPKSIKCGKGELTRFHSDVLSFQQMSEQFNQELSLSGKIPSGHFNSMFGFSGSWQKDAANTKSLAFNGVFISLYSVALEKSQMILCDHVIKEVPSSWEPAALARFIRNYGTHVIVGVKMGGKDVIYVKQQYSSSLQPDEVQKRLKEMADKRFSDASGQFATDSGQGYQNEKFEGRDPHLKFADRGSLSSYTSKEDTVSICKRRGGSDARNLSHQEWLQTVQLEPDVISMSFIPVTCLLNGVTGSGFLSYAINLYLRYKPPIEELHQFLEFQIPRQWAPVFSDLPLGPQRRQQNSASLQFSLMGPQLNINTNPVMLLSVDPIYVCIRFAVASLFYKNKVDVGKKPVTGLRLYLEGNRTNRLAIHLQHLTALPKVFQLDNFDPNDHYRQGFYEQRFYEKVNWKNFSHVCSAPIESDLDLSFVTGAQLLVGDHGFKTVLFLRLRFSTFVGAATIVKLPEWVGSSPGFARKFGFLSTLISHSLFAEEPPKPPDVNINSAVYPEGPPVPQGGSKLLKFVDTTELTRGPEDAPGYWIVSGARLLVENGKISMRVKFSLLTMIQQDDKGSE